MEGLTEGNSRRKSAEEIQDYKEKEKARFSEAKRRSVEEWLEGLEGLVGWRIGGREEER